MSVNLNIYDTNDDWLKARSGRIGGSEAAAIIGMNPYMSNLELWRRKTGREIAEDISDKPYVIYGNEAEPHLRAMFELDFPEYQVRYVDNNMFINDKYPFAHASLDGWLLDPQGRLGILEIKTSEIMNSSMWLKWNNRIPDNYYIQVLHYMMVMEADFAILKAQLKTNYGDMPSAQIKHCYIDRKDVIEDIKYLAREEEIFYRHIVEDTPPNLILPQI